jgi:prepilin-type N-terminal cleavage/methylation domain-containing protein
MIPPGSPSSAAEGLLASPAPRASLLNRLRCRAGLTLVEVVISMTIFAVFMTGFLATFMQSRRLTESSVLHAACTSVVYGIIEQIKQLDYPSSLPSGVPDPTDPTTNVTPFIPFVRVRINQNQMAFIRTKYTPAPASGAATPQAPTTTPASTVTAQTVFGGTDYASYDNFLSSIPLSTVTGSMSQTLNLQLWVWIDEIPLVADDVSECKKVTIVYTYSYQDGGRTRVIRNREVFLRTRYDR